MFVLRLCAFVGLLLPTVMAAEPVAPILSPTGYIEYIPGTLPLIITAPHGGSLKPSNMPDRKFGVIALDSNTQQLTRQLANDLETLTHARPHVIICRLHRVKLDANRELDEAAQGGATAETAWKEWHHFVQQAKRAVEGKFTAGLLIDMHGHRHTHNKVELGYLVQPEQLRRSNSELERSSLVLRMASIRDLVDRSEASFTEVLRGQASLGAMLEARGFLCIPSPSQLAPSVEEEYYKGGFNTETHGSRLGGPISAIQIEAPYEGVRDKPTNYLKFSRAVAESLIHYVPLHLRVNLRAP
jgi:N-formylglutamate amidohydrolase